MPEYEAQLNSQGYSSAWSSFLSSLRCWDCMDLLSPSSSLSSRPPCLPLANDLEAVYQPTKKSVDLCAVWSGIQIGNSQCWMSKLSNIFFFPPLKPLCATQAAEGEAVICLSCEQENGTELSCMLRKKGEKNVTSVVCLIFLASVFGKKGSWERK